MLIFLNIWYFASHYQWLTESLPLYHCRIFMLGLIICHYLKKDNGKIFFAIGGIVGSTLAFSIPETDPFNFPHFTIINFILGHELLLINALITIRFHYRKVKFKEIFVNFTLMSTTMCIANFFFSANYGFLANPPKLLGPFVSINPAIYPILFTSAMIIIYWFLSEILDTIKNNKKIETEIEINPTN